MADTRPPERALPPDAPPHDAPPPVALPAGTPPGPPRADAAPTEIMPTVRSGRWSRWHGTLPLATVTRRRPGSSTLPERPTETDTPTTLAPPHPQLLARVLAGLRALPNHGPAP
ncbi:hypothetical protein [Actinopolyspora xinjiangensis]|uniref:hypothetical protein n=1 Tax=Actinopolyspora xinjiangensis TaxID=405564 RepID=UPI001113BAC3|nr:hypothetical protein [Actinopolyspora xinjiangensis]